MKTKFAKMTRLLALCMVAMLVLGMTSSALAVQATGTYSLTKYLVMSQTTSVPPVTFQFAVTHDGTCAQDADMANNKPQIMEGLGTPTIVDVAFTAGQTGTSTTPETITPTATTPTGITAADINGGKFIKDTGAISFAGIDFDQPGIYRYIITESIKTVGSATGDGVTLDTPATRYMDVYVSNKADYSALEVQSVIIHKANDNVTNGNGVDEKDTGFINKYITYDLSLEKEVTGNQGYRGKYFQFTVVISGAVPGTQYVVDGDVNSTPANAPTPASTSPLTVGTDGSVTATFYLKHGEKLYIRGLTANTSYNITENIADTEGYTVSRTVSGGTITVAATETKTTGTIQMGDSSDDVKFTNYRQGVVPTGILLDVAPYALLVAIAGMALVLLMNSKRKHAAE